MTNATVADDEIERLRLALTHINFNSNDAYARHMAYLALRGDDSIGKASVQEFDCAIDATGWAEAAFPVTHAWCGVWEWDETAPALYRVGDC